MTPPASAAPAVAAEAVADVTAASGLQSLAWLLVALPLLGAAVLLLGGRRTNRWGHWLGVAMSWAAFVVGLAIFASLLLLPAEERSRRLHLFEWVPAGSFSADVAFLVDPLSMTFVLLVTFVGSLIHVYSVAYMEHDAGRRRFFAYLNLFIAAMLLLVLADNYLLLYVGWEGVGLASYLLIGFWSHNPAYAAASKKAFVVNRVGDFGLAIAIFTMFLVFGAVDFQTVFASAEAASQAVLLVIGLMLLLGATGKSAQFPLQSWLLDAMAGPTPVSALIHAATMVTAGVYLVVRSAPIYSNAPTAQLLVAVVGAITLVYGAIIGCAKDDIKKVLAASTMSQIGYMMLAAGLGPLGYAYAIFHLVTHGFFKANMFLGAGSVMHGMGDQVDMRRFGDLAGAMRTTWLTFGAGWLAIIGFPLLSGFWSKDRIIEAAFIPQDGQEWRAWVFGSVALLTAGLTAFYMSRLFFMTFHGRKRWDPDRHPHESPKLMTIPMVVLAIGSVVLGGLLVIGGAFVHWLEPVVGHAEHAEPVLPIWAIMALTIVLVAIGVGIAWRQYAATSVSREVPAGSFATRAARRDLYQDAFNEGVFMRPGQYLTRSLVYADRRGIDGLVGGTASSVGGSAERLRRLQTGFVRSYAASMLGGVVLVLLMLLVVR